MGRMLLGVGLATAALALADGEALACGDKFLVVGRGVRSQRTLGAVHRASILMYLDPASTLPTAAKDLKLDSSLKLAGHSVRSVADLAALDQELKTGRYDVVLADIAEMEALEPVVHRSTLPPTLLPVIYNPTGEELAEAERRYSCLMRSPSTSKSFLAVIDEAVTERAERRKQRVPKTP